MSKPRPPISDETRAKMKAARAKRSPPNLGNKHTDETKQKMAQKRTEYWAKIKAAKETK